MQTIDEAREHCRFVGKGIEKVAEKLSNCQDDISHLPTRKEYVQ
jgi:hypothetical protein